ncbi:NUMOD4 domain-containing protein [Bacillus pseudomycoides]
MLFLIEEWKECEGYKGLYEVSNKGRVRKKTKDR